uniref:SpoU_methylase domain-containing protein n=1 Tax=Syphacia muris TaxID=451379 RepID=A0A0N5B036_9BILA
MDDSQKSLVTVCSSSDAHELDELQVICWQLLCKLRILPSCKSDQVVQELTTLLEDTSNFNYKLVLKFLNCLLDVSAWNDSEAIGLYFDITRTLFHKCENFNEVLFEYFDDFIRRNNAIPNWKGIYKPYSSDITNILNQLGSHTQFHDDESSLLRLSRDFAWLLLLAPKPTLWLFLNHCFEVKAIVPSALKVLRHVPALCILKLNHEGKSAVDFNKPTISIVLCVLSRMLRARKFIYSRELMSDGSMGENDWDRYIYLVAALSRGRRSAEQEEAMSGVDEAACIRNPLKDEVLSECIVTGTEILKGIVLPEIFSRRHVVPMLIMVLKLVSYYQGRRVSIISWKCDFDENLEESSSVSAPFLLRLMIDLYNENLRGGGEARDLCLRILPAFGKRLEVDEVKFSLGCVKSLLSYLNGFEWSLKYAVVTWFNVAFGSPKREIPTGLYKALADDVRRDYNQIVVDFDFTLSDCFFQSLCELASLAPQLAVDIVNKGFAVKPAGDDLFIKLSYEFMLSVLRKPCLNYDKFCAFFDVAKLLLRSLDHGVRSFMPFSITESTVYGLRLIEPLVMFGNVIIIGLSFNHGVVVCSSPDRLPVEFSIEDVDKILEYFCQMVKDHLEKEVQDLRRSRLTYVPLIKEPLDIFKDIKLDRLNRVFIQISELFFLVTMISRLYSKAMSFKQDGDSAVKLPGPLKILLLKVSQYQKEVMSYMDVPDLDQFDNDMRKEPVFYAYACGSEKAREREKGYREGTDQAKVSGSTNGQSHYDGGGTFLVVTHFPKKMGSSFSASDSDGVCDVSLSSPFTKLARNVPDVALREAVLRTISGTCGGKSMFKEAINGIKQQARLTSSYVDISGEVMNWFDWVGLWWSGVLVLQK